MLKKKVGLSIIAVFNRTSQDEVFCDKKPDADNILKLVMDALNGFAYADDKQVVYTEVCKIYGSSSHTEIKIRTVEEFNGV